MIAAGGTGGHVYPALAVAEVLQASQPDVPIFFVGTVGGFERPLIDNSGVEFTAYDEVQAGPIHGVNPLRMLSSVFKLMVGTLQSFRLLRRHKPDVIFSTGGWVSLPVALISWVLRIPMVIFLPDIEPGLTIKLLRLFARKVALTVADSERYFRKRQTVVTGYALRAEMLKQAREFDRDDAIAHFGLDPARKTILVFGGSRGARAINIGLIKILPELLQENAQVLHLTGTLDAERASQQVSDLGDVAHIEHYHPKAYLHEDMALAFGVADVAVCRSGASTLAEFPLFSLPSVLIPLAYSWRYQQINADYLQAHGAGIHLDEGKMDTDLLPILQDLLRQSGKLEAMADKAQALARADGAENIANLLLQLAGKTA